MLKSPSKIVILVEDMMTVKGLATRAGVTSDAVRYYVRLGLLHPARDPENGYRLFTGRDIDRLRFINRAKSLGFTLAEIIEVFTDAETGKSPCPRVRAILQHHIEENSRRMDELSALRARMGHAARQWRDMDDGMPDEDSICLLIEAIDA